MKLSYHEKAGLTRRLLVLEKTGITLRHSGFSFVMRTGVVKETGGTAEKFNIPVRIVHNHSGCLIPLFRQSYTDADNTGSGSGLLRTAMMVSIADSSSDAAIKL